MANTLTEVIPKLLAQGLLALRQQAIMPRLVNRGYDPIAGQRGSTIDVPIPSAVTIQDVTPSNTPPSTADQTPTSVPIALTNWKEAPFHLSDKDRMEAMEGFLPMQASEAVKAIANKIDADILALYKGVYGYTGTAGTTPFASDLTAFTRARAILHNQLAPMDDRRVVLNPDAEGNALLLRAFQDASFGGGTGTILRGQIGTKMGADWWMDQNVPSHAAGSLPGSPIVNGAVSAGQVSCVLSGLGNSSGAVVIGDVIFFSGGNYTSLQNFVLTASAANAAASAITLNFLPALPSDLATGVTVGIRANHVVNMAFHRDAFALAMRPLEREGENVAVATDPVSGLTMRLEVTREHKRWRYSYDVLYGVKMVRAALACRIAG